MRIKFVKQDCWLGVYWDSNRIYICIIPCFPIIINRHKENVCQRCKQHKINDDYCKCPENQDHDEDNNCPDCGRCVGKHWRMIKNDN